MIFDNCLVASCNKNEGFNTSCNCFIDCILNSLSTIVSISFGTALVAGKKRVPRPATGKTALRIGLGTIMLHFQKDDPTTKVNAFDWWYHNMGSVTGAGIAEITNQMEYDDEVSHHACAKLYDLSRGKDKRPWCLTVSFTHPHDPYVARKKILGPIRKLRTPYANNWAYCKGKAWYHLAKVKYVKVPWQWNMPQKGSYAPLISLRSGKWKFNRCSIDPDQLFDMETDPHELNNLASNPAYSQVAAEFRAQATKRWNLEQFDSDVRHSQASRWIVYEALRNGKYFPWDYQPLQKASERYMRNHMDLNVLEENQRFPRATGEVIAKVHSATPAIIEQAINSAQSAQKKWAATSNADRGRILRKAAAIIRERNRDLSILESYDTGKPLQETLVADATSGADSLEYFGGLAATLTGEHIPLGESWAYTVREPLGICVGIGAWNYPTQIACWKSAPALTCGNAMIFKPSETTPLSALKIAEIYIEAGLPADANIEDAISGAILGNFYSSGQVCSNGTRVFVHSAIKEKFLTRLKERTQAAIIGDPMDEETNFGPMVSENQVKIVQSYVAKGIKEGATLFTVETE
ncbi:NAD/NADP-dependent betaine aldehyde dehydrogenase [Nymphon striatum]|nr:NAD/NADP-dependent betaine aldehyde dehydrogenase [Nymphon striatum]